MARRWRQRLFTMDVLTNDLLGPKRLRYAAWFDPPQELSVRDGWAVQYESVDMHSYQRSWRGVDPAAGPSQMRAWLVCVEPAADQDCAAERRDDRNPCGEIVLEFWEQPPGSRGGRDDGT